MGRTGRTLETQTNGSSHFTDGEKPRLAVGERLVQVHRMSVAEAGLNPGLLTLSSMPNYLLLPTKEECRRAFGYVWVTIPEKYTIIKIIKIKNYSLLNAHSVPGTVLSSSALSYMHFILTTTLRLGNCFYHLYLTDDKTVAQRG